MDPLRAAALSPNAVSGDVEHNLDAAGRGIERARREGVDLAVFSEMYLTHCYDDRSFRVAQPVPGGPAVREIVSLAREQRIHVAMGIEELDVDRGVVYNTHFLCGPDGYVGKHRKTHCMISELHAHRPGADVGVFDFGPCKVGVEICHEAMYPELSRIQTLAGMEVLLAPFGCGGSAKRVEPEAWVNDFHMACWRARCFDNGVFMIVSGGNGHPGGTFRTYACVIDPYAEVIARIEPDPDVDGLNMVIADLDPERFVARRTDPDYPVKKRRPELYGPLCEPY